MRQESGTEGFGKIEKMIDLVLVYRGFADMNGQEIESAVKVESLSALVQISYLFIVREFTPRCLGSVTDCRT